MIHRNKVLNNKPCAISAWMANNVSVLAGLRMIRGIFRATAPRFLPMYQYWHVSNYADASKIIRWSFDKISATENHPGIDATSILCLYKTISSTHAGTDTVIMIIQQLLDLSGIDHAISKGKYFDFSLSVWS